MMRRLRASAFWKSSGGEPWAEKTTREPGGHFFHFLDGDGALAFQFGHHVGIVDNLVLDVHRRAEPLQAEFHHLNRPDDPGAEPAGGA